MPTHGPERLKDETQTKDHLLLTVLGTNPKRAEYTLEDRHAEAILAPVALFELLPNADRPHRVVAICTPEAKRETLPLLERDLEERIRVDSVDVPSGDIQKDIDVFLTRVTETIPEDVELTVDVTHGFRHFSFLTYIAVLYLAALRGVCVRGAYYGLLRSNDTSPFLDLRPLLQLPRWVHALEVLGETGSFLPMAKALEDESAGPTTKKIASELSMLSESLLSGLPLELGRHASLFQDQRIKPLRRLLTRNHRLPLAPSLVERLDRSLVTFSLIEPVSGAGWKGQVPLSEDELKRQTRIIDALLEHGNVATALGLMNEWTVSWAVLQRYPEDNWLDYPKVRRKAAGLLGAIEAVHSDDELSNDLSAEQCSLGAFWKDLRNLRNAYHHHGMRRQVVIGHKEAAGQLEKIRKYWSGTLRSYPRFDLSLGEAPGGRVLVSPIGKRPGVLFSALEVCRARGEDMNTCVVICSHETRDLIEEASRHAGYTGTVVPLALEDPYGGMAEIDGLVKIARRHFIGSGQVFVNVTGGTTLIGLAAERLADAARQLACPVSRFGLIDRRPPKQQDEDPYQVGEPFWFDS